METQKENQFTLFEANLIVQMKKINKNLEGLSGLINGLKSEVEGVKFEMRKKNLRKLPSDMYEYPENIPSK